jgi:hypothetical protein
MILQQLLWQIVCGYFCMKQFETISFEINDNGTAKKITAKPHPEPIVDNVPQSFEIAINGFPRGKIKYGADKWTSNDLIDEKLVKVIGEKIDEHYGLK